MLLALLLKDTVMAEMLSWFDSLCLVLFVVLKSISLLSMDNEFRINRVATPYVVKFILSFTIHACFNNLKEAFKHFLFIKFDLI